MATKHPSDLHDQAVALANILTQPKRRYPGRKVFIELRHLEKTATMLRQLVRENKRLANDGSAVTVNYEDLMNGVGL